MNAPSPSNISTNSIIAEVIVVYVKHSLPKRTTNDTTVFDVGITHSMVVYNRGRTYRIVLSFVPTAQFFFGVTSRGSVHVILLGNHYNTVECKK